MRIRPNSPRGAWEVAARYSDAENGAQVPVSYGLEGEMSQMVAAVPAAEPLITTWLL